MKREDLYTAVINKENAAGYVHADILQTDLAVIVKGRGEDGHGVPMTEKNLADMLLTDEEALEIAQSHTDREHFTCMTIGHALGLDAEKAEIDPETSADLSAPYSDIPLYVLSNSRAEDGAAAITRPEILKDIIEKLGPVYVLPSSVHEVLILPKAQAPDVESLRAMVQEVNATQVAPEERLSGNVYEISGSRLVIAKSRTETQEQSEKKQEEKGMQL